MPSHTSKEGLGHKTRTMKGAHLNKIYNNMQPTHELSNDLTMYG
jgi:hypothetical protein